MKVLHVIGGVGPGGAETLMARLVTRASNVEHEVICLGGRDWYSDTLEEHGITVHYLGMSRLSAVPSGLSRVARLVRSSGANVVQGWMYRSNILASLAARRAGLPSVWSIHCASLEPLGLSARLWAYASGTLAGTVPAAVINCSRRSIAMHERLGFGRANVVCIPNGYDPSVFHPDDDRRVRTRTALSVKDGDFVIGTVSRWHPEKDIPNLIGAVADLKRRGIRTRCLLVGHRLDPSNVALMSAIRDADVEQEMVPLGRRGDVPDLLRAIDLLVLPSRSESFPNVVPEAMLSGTPCVVTDVGDAATIVGDTGWVAPPRDPEALASAIADARDAFERDRPSWQQRGRAARERIERNYTLDLMARRYQEVWAAAAAAS